MSTKAERKRQEKIRKNIGIAVKVLIVIACLVLGIIYYVGHYSGKEESSDTYSTAGSKEKDSGNYSTEGSKGKSYVDNSTTGSKVEKKSGSSQTVSPSAGKKDSGNVEGSGNIENNENGDNSGNTENSKKTAQINAAETVAGIAEGSTDQKEKLLTDSPEEIFFSGADIGLNDGKININTAGLDELCRLNGIGEKRARDIIDYRNTHGSFAKIEDIMKVKGIKQGIFSKIRDEITTG